MNDSKAEHWLYLKVINGLWVPLRTEVLYVRQLYKTMQIKGRTTFKRVSVAGTRARGAVRCKSTGFVPDCSQ